MGGLFIDRSVNAIKVVVSIFRGDIANFYAVGKLCLGCASCRPQLERARRPSAFVLIDHRFSRALVGDSILGDRVDVGGSFGAAANPYIFRRLRGAGDAASNPDRTKPPSGI